MSPRVQDAPARTGRAIVVLLVMAAVAVGLALLARVKPRNEILDPASGSASGARGLVLVLQSVGASVKTTSTVPSAGGPRVDRVVVLVDHLSDAQREQLDKWVSSGGIAVVADPNSPYQGSDATFSSGRAAPSDIDKGDCTIAALAKLSSVSLHPNPEPRIGDHTGTGADDGVADARELSVAAGDTGCFGTPSAAFVVARQRGAGFIVGLGENWILSNQMLASGDNAALATALMAPTDSSKVVILHGTGAAKRTANVVAGGDKSLLQLVPTQVWIGIAGLVLAFVVFSIAAGWRVGRPVVERPLVPIAGSDLVVSTARLMQRAGHTQRAAELMRYQFHRDLCATYSIDPAAPLDVLDRSVCARLDDHARLAPRQLIDVLKVTDVPDAASLTDLARQIRHLRNETL